MLDIKAIEAEVKKELSKDLLDKAKSRLKIKLAQVESAKVVLANLNREYEDLLVTIAEGN